MATQLKITYQVDDLFDLVQMETLHIANAGDLGQVDNIAMTNSEENIFKRLLKQGANDTFKVISAFSDGINESDVPIYLDDTKLEFVIVPPTSINLDIYTPILTNKLQDTIIKYIITEWLRIKGAGTQWKVEKFEYNKLLKDLKSCLFHTQKPAIRKYRGF